MENPLSEVYENKIKSLVKRCKTNATKYGSYTTKKEDYSLIQSESISRVIALIEEDNKHICITKESSTLFETRKNPNYKKWYQIDWVTALVTFLFGILATVITNQLSNQQQDQQLQKISDSVGIQKARIDTLKNVLYIHLNDSTKHK
jgi:hypothetical protein